MTTLYERLGSHAGIARLLHSFYADVRQHSILGPIFNAAIRDWPHHEQKVTEFWARQTGGPSRYGGGFAGAHFQLPISTDHFAHWLSLWEFNCRRHLAETEARELIQIAHLLASRLIEVISRRPAA